MSGNFEIGAMIHGGSDQNQCNGNVVNNNGGIPGGGGFLIVSSDGNVIANNDISGNTPNIGVRLFDSHGNIIQGNTANANSNEGIRMDPGSTENIMEGNTALGNQFDLADYNPAPAPPCSNIWMSNTFVTDSEGDGPGAGCIR